MHEYDVVVLGGGTAGSAAAQAAHEHGATVAMFNDGELGGLCILRGCMPTKTMLHAAHLAHEGVHSRTPGVEGDVRLDFGAIMRNKDAKVERFKKAKVDSIESAGYTIIDARARFIDASTVEAGGERYRFRRGAVIATGSVPYIPPFAGVESVPYWTSDDVMELDTRPESIIVVGSGAIGLELGQFFARMGTRVTLASRTPVLSKIDTDIAAEAARFLDAEPGFELIQPARIQSVTHDDEGFTLRLEGRDVRAERLLIAAGRATDVEGLGLAAAGVFYDPDEAAELDTSTSHPHVFVAGDATGERMLLHVANWEGRVAGLRAARVPGDHRVERRLHMSIVFTDPPFATVGLSELQARREGRAVRTAQVRFAETGRAITQDVRFGLCKLVADAESGELLGAQILGPRADDIIHTPSTVLFYRGHVEDLLAMPWYHPTISEVMLGLARDLATPSPSTR